MKNEHPYNTVTLPVGAGKTSIMHKLAGLLRSYEEHIEIKDSFPVPSMLHFTKTGTSETVNWENWNDKPASLFRINNHLISGETIPGVNVVDCDGENDHVNFVSLDIINNLYQPQVALLVESTLFSENVTRFFSRYTDSYRRKFLLLLDSFAEISARKYRAKIKLDATSHAYLLEHGYYSKPARVEKWHFDVAFNTAVFKYELLEQIASYFNSWEENNTTPNGMSAVMIAFYQFINKRTTQASFRIKAYYRKIIYTNIRDIRFHLRNLVCTIHITPNDGKEDAISNSFNNTIKNLLINSNFFILWIQKKLNNYLYWRTPSLL